MRKETGRETGCKAMFASHPVSRLTSYVSRLTLARYGAKPSPSEKMVECPPFPVLIRS